MTLKVIGAILIVLSCGGFGYYLAWQYLKEEKSLQELMRILEYMECDLQYHLTPLPVLLLNCSNQTNGSIACVLRSLSRELERQIAPDVDYCMKAAISTVNELPYLSIKVLKYLGKQLGKLDLNGQINCIAGVKRACCRYLDMLNSEKQMRLHRYKTLGLCAGAGLIILFI